MKIIKVPTEFLQADGSPFRQAKRDPKGNLIFQLDKSGEPMKDSTGNRLVDIEDATFADILKTFLNNTFNVAQAKKKDLTIEDSSQAVDIHRAIRVMVDGRLELEKAPHEWLLKKVDEYGVDIIGVNAAVLKEILSTTTEETPSRGERRREAKAEKAG